MLNRINKLLHQEYELVRTIKPRTVHHNFIKWFSRVVITVTLIVWWILLRRDHITTIH